MVYSKEEIIEDIKNTLDQIKKNAAVLQLAKGKPLFRHEVEQLELLQESLLARVIHKKSLLEKGEKSQNAPSLGKSLNQKQRKQLTIFPRTGRRKSQKAASLRKASSRS